MKVIEIIQILRNKIAGLEKTKASAYEAGNLDEVARLDNEIAETVVTLQKLETLE